MKPRTFPIFLARPIVEISDSLLHRAHHTGELRLVDLALREEDDVIAAPWSLNLMAHSPHPALRPISPYRVAEFLTGNKSNATAHPIGTVALLRDYKRYIWRMETPASFKQATDLCAGFDDIQPRYLLDGQALTTLVTASLQHGATALGSHTSTEAMGLRALTLVRLISPLHFSVPFMVDKE